MEQSWKSVTKLARNLVLFKFTIFYCAVSSIDYTVWRTLVLGTGQSPVSWILLTGYFFLSIKASQFRYFSSRLVYRYVSLLSNIKWHFWLMCLLLCVRSIVDNSIGDKSLYLIHLNNMVLICGWQRNWTKHGIIILHCNNTL